MKKALKLLISVIVILAIGFFGGKYVGGLISHAFPMESISGNDVITSEHVSSKQPTFDTLIYPYYAMLDEDQKVVYGELYEAVKERSESFLPSVKINQDSLQEVFISFTSDHPEMFYVENQYHYDYMEDSGDVVNVIPEYNEYVESFEQQEEAFESTIQDIVNIAQTASSQYEQEKIVHDTLIDLIQYETDSEHNQSAYSALVNRKTVCAGFAKGFQVVMQRLGIPCYYVMGTSVGEDHAWNIVCLDGNFYNVDITWDDSGENTDTYYFFNLEDDSFNEYHERSAMSQQLPVCTDPSLAHIEDADIYERIIFTLP